MLGIARKARPLFLVTILLLSGCEARQVEAAFGITSPHRPSASLNWAALRRCESGGNYHAVNPTGSYRGTYQFGQGTWNGVVATIAPRYVGVRPDHAPSIVQDHAAQALYDARGRQPWPVCGRRL